MNSFELIGPVPSGDDSFTDQRGDEICELIASGKTMLEIEKREGMPSRRTVSRWVLKYPGFASQYALARTMQADHEFDEIRQIADDEGLEPDEKRVRIDSRKWRAERLNPRAYGSKVVHQHSVDQDTSLEAEALPGGLAFLAHHKSEEGGE